MVDFKKLVEGLLVVEKTKTTTSYGRGGAGDFGAKPYARQSSANPQSQTPTTQSEPTLTPNPPQQAQNQTEKPDDDEKQTADSINGFLKSQYNPIAIKFKEVFKDYYDSQAGAFPNETNFTNLVYTVTKNAIRDTENVGVFENDIASLFPLIDLIALCKQKFTEAKGKPEEKINTLKPIVAEFLARLDQLKKQNKKMPLEFQPLSPWAANVKARYFEKEGKIDIGKLKLEQSQSLQSKSIRDAVMELLEHRRKSKIKLFKKEIKIGSAANVIDDILQNPDKYIGGEISFPDKKLNLLYSGDTPSLLISVAKNAKNLFDQQIEEKQIPKEEATAELYNKFLLNQAQKFLNPQTRRVLANVEQSKQARASSKFKGFKEALESVLANLLEQEVSSFPSGAYTVKDIQTYAKTVPQSQQLYNSLKRLADYIKTEAESIDWSGVLSGATQVAKGLSLGT